MSGRVSGMMFAVTMTAEDFLSALASEVPETQPVGRGHFEDNDELLLHLLTADLRRYAIGTFASGQSDVLRSLLGVIDRALLLGNDYVSNAIAVSFVADSGWWDPAMQPFIASRRRACRPRRAGNGNPGPRRTSSSRHHAGDRRADRYAIAAPLCAGARRLKSLSVTGFPASLRPRLAGFTAAG